MRFENHKNKVHHILAHSYSFFLIFLLLGIFFHILFPVKIFTDTDMAYWGLAFLILATGLIFWAQRTSRHLKVEHLTKDNFMRGPYAFTRSPTHYGLFFLVLGFGLIANSFFIALFAVIAFFVTKFFSIKKQEAALFLKYGAPYLEYTKIVRF